MSLVTREILLNAILVKIQAMTFSSTINGQTSWQTTGRRLRLWNAVPPEEQPAAFLVEHEEHDEWRGLGTERRRLNPRVWCYARTDDPSIIGGTYINTMLEAFEAQFGMSAQDNFSTGQVTLFGQAYFVRIEGRVFKDPGDIDSQALLIVPLICEMP